MEKKIIEYGTQHKCKVLSATEKLITVVGDDGEGYMLMGHGIKKLPKEGDNGKITFIKSNTPFKGYWHYEGAKTS
jgi:hypothetical protein